MKIKRLSVKKGDALATTLVDARELEGLYYVVPRVDDATKHMLVPAATDLGDYTAVTGYDPRRRQWITLCRGEADAVVMLGRTTKPLA